MGRSGVIPPGRAGLIVLAVAMVPIAIKHCRPAVRWAGRKLKQAGDTLDRMIDDVERFDREKKEREARAATVESPVADPPKEQPAAKAKPKSAPKKPTSSPKKEP